MSLQRIVKCVINEPGRRSECSVYISIILAHIEKQNWIEARNFFKLACETIERYEEYITLRSIAPVLRNENIKACLCLLDCIKEEKE